AHGCADHDRWPHRGDYRNCSAANACAARRTGRSSTPLVQRILHTLRHAHRSGFSVRERSLGVPAGPPPWTDSLITYTINIPSALLVRELVGEGWRRSLTWLLRVQI